MGGKNNKRELILAAAREVFFEKGYYNTTSEEIAKCAGVAKGTLYQYFESKLEIFLEMHRCFIEEYVAALQNRIDEKCSFEENLHQIVRFHIENIQNVMQYSSRILADVPPVLIGEKKPYTLKKMHEQMLHEKILGIFEALVANGVKRGEIRKTNVHLLLIFVFGAFAGTFHLMEILDMTKEERDALEDEIVYQIMHGIAVQ